MKRLLVIVATLLCLTTPAMAAAAYNPNPLSGACGAGGGGGSAACSADGSDPLTGPNGVIKKASLLIGIIAGIAAVIIIMFSGFRYITANGDAQKAASARNGIVGAAVGLVIIAASTTIVVFVVSKV